VATRARPDVDTLPHVIVVIGPVAARVDGDRTVPAGLAARVATTAASAGRAVEVVTRLGDDAVGDAVLLSLAASGIGHVATLRDAAHATPAMVSVDGPSDPDVGDDATESDGGREVDASATARATTPALDPEDVGLALRYLADYRVIVVVHPAQDDVVSVTVAAAGYAGAHLVVISAPGAPLDGLPGDALALSAPDDADGVASLVGRYAAAVDEGVPPETAWAAEAGMLGVD